MSANKIFLKCRKNKKYFLTQKFFQIGGFWVGQLEASNKQYFDLGLTLSECMEFCTG